MLKKILRSSVYLLAGLAFLILFYAAIIFAGWQIGKGDGDLAATTQFITQNQRQLELAQQDIANDNIALAVRRMQSLNQAIPEDAAVIALAVTLTKYAEVAKSAEPTQPLPTPFIITSGGAATATPTPSPTPTTTPRATATPTIVVIPATPRPEHIQEKLNAIEALLEDTRWEEAITSIVAFQLENPAYERFYTDSLLFKAYIGGGFAFTNGNRVTLGISYFEQAQKLGDLPEDAAGQLRYSRDYLTAMSYYGIDWSISVSRLAEICRLAPDFQNSCNLLFNARDAWGDQFGVADDYCAAEEQYRLALQLSNSNEVAKKMNSAKWKCQHATATPWQADS